jgi:hypothetical protein
MQCIFGYRPTGLSVMQCLFKKVKAPTAAGSLRKSEEGQGLVEGAMVLLLLLLLIFAIIDFSVLFFVYNSLEQGISEATRYGITGQQMDDPNNPGNYLSREESVKLVMRQWNFLVTLPDAAFTFEHRAMGASGWSSGSGGPSDIARVTVNYNWRLITPLIRPLFTGGQVSLRVSSTMLNENYPSP